MGHRPIHKWSHQRSLPDRVANPIWTRIFPQYETQDREAGIGRYWDEYYSRVDQLVARHPNQVRLFETDRALNTQDGLLELLSFAGVPPERHVSALDYAFCQRARECDFAVVADSTIRLRHVGTYAFGWEDADVERQRHDRFTLHFPDSAGRAE